MKKLFTLITLLCATFFAQQASAAEYDLWINGERITDSNKNQITGSFGNGSVTGGTITFNSSTYTLNIPAGVTITAGNSSAIEVAKMNLTIKIGSGTVNIYAKNNDCNGIRMTTEGNYTCTIEGSNTSSNTRVSTLNITAGQNKSAFHIHKKCTGIVKNVYIFTSNSSNAKFGIDGNDGSSNETLKVEGYSELVLNAQSYAIGDINTLSLGTHDFYISGSDWTNVTGIYFKDHYVKNSSGNSAYTCWIKPYTSYYFSVCGQTVNNLNASYIGARLNGLGYLTSAASTVSYNNSSKTLTLNGATLKSSVDGVYNSGCSGLTIACTGANSITTTATYKNYAGLYLSSNTTVKGPGSLVITSSTRGVLVGYSSTATFSGGLATTIKGTDAVKGYYDTSEDTNPNHNTQNNKVVFDNVSVTMTATNGDVCSTFGGGIDVTNCDVVTTGMHVRGPASYTNGRPGYGIGTKGSSGGWSAATNTTVNIRNGGTSYPLSIGARRINSNNYQNISWEGISGTVTYTPSTATLALNDATITCSDNYGINVYSGFKTMSLTGTNKISSMRTCFELNDASTSCTITGAGTLELENTDSSYPAIRFYGTNESLTINCAKLTAKGKTYGIYGRNGDATLSLNKYSDNSTYIFYGPGYGSMVGLTKLTLNNTDFAARYQGNTEGAYFDEDDKRVEINSDNSAAKGYIQFQVPTTYYQLYIAGKQLNDLNCDYVGSKYITAGGSKAVRYVPSENTLYLKGATIQNGTSSGDTHGAGNPIRHSISGLTIKVTEASNIQTTDSYYYPLSISESTTITSSTENDAPAKLTISGHSTTVYSGTNNAHLTFKDTDVKISGSINFNNNKTSDVVVDNSTVSIGNQIFNAKSVTAKNGTVMLKPQGGKYDATAGYMKLANGNQAYGIEFGKPVSYGLSIDGTSVTNANNTDPTGDGTFSYDPNTKTLTVKKNYTGKDNGSPIISNSEIDGLTINFTDGWMLTDPTSSCIYTTKSTKIHSSIPNNKITLVNNSSSGDGIGLYGSNTKLTIDNVTMSITAPYGIYSSSSGNNDLLIYNSALTITATQRCIGTFKTIETQYVAIDQPSGAKFKDGKVVNENGGELKGTLVIKRIATGIEKIEADDFTGDDLNVDGVDNAEGIYDLNGRKLTEMQRGVNIIRRRDGSTVKVVKK